MIKTYSQFIQPTIFLDIDGVLKPYNSSYNSSIFFNKESIQTLNTIYSHLSPQLIISSNWRFKYTLNELKQIFTKNNLPQPTNITIKLTTTPDIITLPQTRTKEILLFVKKYSLTNYLALDDYKLPLPKNHFLQIDKKLGLTKQYIPIILNLFNN